MEDIIDDYNNVGGDERIIVLAKQLLDTLRENISLKTEIDFLDEQLKYTKTSEDK